MTLRAIPRTGKHFPGSIQILRESEEPPFFPLFFLAVSSRRIGVATYFTSWTIDVVLRAAGSNRRLDNDWSNLPPFK